MVLRKRRVFIGYPPWRAGVEPQRGHLRDAIVDLHCPDEEWKRFCGGLEGDQLRDRREYNENCRLARDVKPGAIVLVPRPERGLVYAGRVVGQFELLNDPPWSGAYLDLIREHRCYDEARTFLYLGDVAQSCKVDEFRRISFPLVPAWIRRSLLGRSTYGRISPIRGLNLDPYSVLDQLLDHPQKAVHDWTVRPADVAGRLADGVGPNTFEHLCVSLLQLEYPEEVWIHVGGSGDGGVDGIGANADGKVVGLLQCKWSYGGEEIVVADKALHGAVREVLATLLHADAIRPRAGVELWRRENIVSLVIKHATRLPLAMALRIGPPKSN